MKAELPYQFTMSARDRLRDRAQYLVWAAIKRGNLALPESLKCVDCGATAECYDHRNYHRPLSVEPVCQPCNIRRGPGYPFPGEQDVRAFANDLKPKGKGIKSAGHRWNLDEGEGESVIEFPVRAGVNWADIDEQQDIAVDASMNASHKNMRHSWNHHNKRSRGYRRDDYFKKHDPWGAA